MLPIALDPYFDPILRIAIDRAARRKGIALADLERSFESTGDAFDWLREADAEEFTAYVESASAAIDHVGWLIVDKRGRRVAL